MLKRCFRLFITLSFLFVTSCGVDEMSSLSRLNVEKETLNIFAFGGNASCKPDDSVLQNSPLGSDIYVNLMRSLKRMNQDEIAGKDIAIFTSCYNMGASKISYYSTWDKDTVLGVAEEDAREIILARLNDFPRSKNLFMGHSYGGWLTMDIIKDLDEGVDIEQLITLDPISKKLCSFTTPGGCLEAPADINNEMRSNIKRNTGKWVNFYQTRTFYLHSSAISHADENFKKNLGHTAMDDNSKLWKEIQNIIEPVVKSI